MDLYPQIPAQIREIQQRLGEAALRSKRKPEAITLLAVSKTFPPDAIRAAYQVGLRHFGENRVQEALEKIPQLPGDIHWHLIGQLQTNKINKILGKFTLLHSLDSLKLAEALSTRLGGGSQEALLEVNSSGEASKSGVAPEKALEEAEKISQLKGLRLKGLMTVGPHTADPEKQRDSFKRLKELFETIRSKAWAGPTFSTLSMGMSGDFEVAIEEGSTLVRVGTALFGQRT